MKETSPKLRNESNDFFLERKRDKILHNSLSPINCDASRAKCSHLDHKLSSVVSFLELSRKNVSSLATSTNSRAEKLSLNLNMSCLECVYNENEFSCVRDTVASIPPKPNAMQRWEGFPSGERAVPGCAVACIELLLAYLLLSCCWNCCG